MDASVIGHQDAKTLTAFLQEPQVFLMVIVIITVIAMEITKFNNDSVGSPRRTFYNPQMEVEGQP